MEGWFVGGVGGFWGWGVGCLFLGGWLGEGGGGGVPWGLGGEAGWRFRDFTGGKIARVGGGGKQNWWFDFVARGLRIEGGRRFAGNSMGVEGGAPGRQYGGRSGDWD